jgi:hypothetical protein
LPHSADVKTVLKIPPEQREKAMDENESAQYLARAIAERVLLRLAVDSDQPPPPLLARPLKLLGEDAHQGVWVDLPNAAPSMLDQLSARLPACRATFAIKGERYAFQTAISKRDRHFWLTEEIMLDALLLSGPIQLLKKDERTSDRLEVSERSGVSATLFSLSPSPGNQAKIQAKPVSGVLHDLSEKGGGFWCTFDRALMLARRGELFACNIQFRGQRIVLKATLMQVSRISDRMLRVGLAFPEPNGDPVSEERLGQLNTVITELKRQQSLRQPRRAI